MRILFNLEYPGYDELVTFWDESDSLPELGKSYVIESSELESHTFKVQFIIKNKDEKGNYYLVHLIPFDT